MFPPKPDGRTDISSYRVASLLKIERNEGYVIHWSLSSKLQISIWEITGKKIESWEVEGYILIMQLKLKQGWRHP